jgi:CheY-like chemotaxis protein
MQIRVLAVDDDPVNLDILCEYFAAEGYEILQAMDGAEALKILHANQGIDVVVLDRMMPVMDGITCVEYMKQDEVLRDIPVIMQTAAASSKQVLEGIEAGVYYYLIKPYERKILLSIVNAALQDHMRKRGMIEEVKKSKLVLGLMESAQFSFSTIQEAQNLAYFLASCYPEPDMAVLGLTELLFNAIEHGNLGYTYEDKKQHLLAGTWPQAIEDRLNDATYRSKRASLHYVAGPEAIEITIIDQGNGFDWQHYLEGSPSRLTDPNGRGILTAKNISFTSVTYHGSGNQVCARLEMP